MGKGAAEGWESSLGPCVFPRLVNMKVSPPPHPVTELQPLLERGHTAGDSPQRQDSFDLQTGSI